MRSWGSCRQRWGKIPHFELHRNEGREQLCRFMYAIYLSILKFKIYYENFGE